MTDFTQTEIGSAYQAGVDSKNGTLQEINGLPLMLIPNDSHVETFPDAMPRPFRIEKVVTAGDAQSMLAYFNRFADADSTIFVDIEARKFVGVLDYHEAQPVIGADCPRPRHGSHKVIFNCPLTPEAKRWLDNDKKVMNQTEFASFIEGGLLEIMEPSGAEMLEIASTMHAKNSVDFKSGIRLDNGEVQFGYSESIDGAAGRDGSIKIPQKLVLAIKLFRGDEVAYRIEANFRWRMASGKLSLWYELVRPHVQLEDAVATIAATIKDGMTNGHMINASA